MEIPIATRTKAEPKEQTEATPRANATEWWEKVKAEFDAVFRQFAKAEAGKSNSHTAADIEGCFEPLKKQAWKVADKRIRESWKNALASAGVQRRRKEAGE